MHILLFFFQEQMLKQDFTLWDIFIFNLIEAYLFLFLDNSTLRK